MTFRIRRILTGHDAEGRSTIIADGIAQNVKEIPGIPGLALTDLWETAGAPASNEGHADAAARPVRLEPPPNGTVFRVVEFPPDAAWRKRTHGGEEAARQGFDAIGAGHAQDRGSHDAMMHKTSTVDYAIVLKGEIHAVLEKGETLLHAGDVLVQRGTNHSWSVRGNEPALVAFILVSAKRLKTKKQTSPKNNK